MTLAFRSRSRRSTRLAAAALVLGSLLPASLLVSSPAVAAAPAPAEVKAPGSVVNINTADEKELLSLPRIGPATAVRILEYRKQVGSFKTVDELLNVKGIGEKTLEVLRPLVTVGAGKTQAPKP